MVNPQIAVESEPYEEPQKRTKFRPLVKEIEYDGIVKMQNGGKNNAIGSILQVLLEVEDFAGHLLAIDNEEIYGETFAMMKVMFEQALSKRTNGNQTLDLQPLTKSLADIFNIEEGHDASAILKYLYQILHDEVITHEDNQTSG